MLEEPAMGRGEEVTLDTRDSARRRVICGLRWGLLADGEHAVERAALAEGGYGASLRDLDLLCLMFDKFGGFIDGVTGEEGFRTGDNGNIYHTGDETGGEESTDDEEIALELFNLSRKIHQIFFIAEVQSDHNFGDVGAPKMRFAYSSGARNVVVADLGGEAGRDRNAYVLGSIRREGTGWVFKYIGDYFDGAAVSDWTVALQDYIDIADPDTNKTYTGMRVPARGQTVPLFYTKEARHRVMCAINWDPGVEEVGKLEKLKNREQNLVSSDIDLACVMYNRDKECVDGVSAKPDEAIDQSGKIYHTGDDTTGDGDQLDDEAISVELRDLPDYIWHIVFLAEIQSRHTFKDLNNPAMRFADGKTDTNQLTTSLTAEEGQDKNAYVFSRISRKGESWSLTFIDEYVDGNSVSDWIEHLKRYLG